MNIIGKIKILLKNNWVELTIFILFISLYAATSSRSIIQGDTGDFLSAAATGGIPHQPGYPLYSLISRIAFLVPFGNPAWQVNLLSAIFASFALVFTYKTIKTIMNSVLSAIFGTLSLGIYQSFWFYALVAEIHILQVLLLSMLFYYLVLLIKTKSVKYLYFSAFVFGLGVSNNHTVIFTIPGIVLVLILLREQINLKNYIIVVLSSLLGLLPYGYLAWIAYLNPITKWGTINNLGSFLSFFFRSQYGTFNWEVTNYWGPFIYSSFVHFFVSIFTTSWYLLPFFVISLLYLVKKNIYYWLFLIGFVFVGPFYYLLMDSPILSVTVAANSEQYLSYSFFFFSILAAFGLNIILKKYKSRKTWIVCTLVVLFFVIPFIYNLPKVRLDDNHLTEIYTKFQLSEIPENSIFITSGDSPYLQILYWQYVTGYRKDVTVISYSLLNKSWYRDSLEQEHPELGDLFDSNALIYNKLCNKYAANDKLFISPMNSVLDTLFQANCKIIPYGLITKVVPKNKIPDIQQIKNFNDKEWNRFTQLLPPLNTFADQYSRSRETLFRFSEHFSFLGSYYVNEGKSGWALNAFQEARLISPDEVNSIIGEAGLLYKDGRTTDAIKILEEGVKREPSISQLYQNLGVYYLEVLRKDKAYENFKKYLSFNPTDDPDILSIKNFISSYETSPLIKLP